MKKIVLIFCAFCKFSLFLNAQSTVTTTDSRGWVGIGTTTTSNPLTVFASRYPTVSIEASDGSNTNRAIIELTPWKQRPGGAPVKLVGLDDALYSAHFAIFTAPTGISPTSYPAVERMRVTSSGRVGIGDFTNPDPQLQPQGMLHIRSNSGNSDLFLESTDGTLWDIVSNNGGLFSLYQKSTGQTRFAISPTGNVGIGTTSPATSLHVQGKGSFGDKVTAANAKRALNLVSTDAVMRIVRVDPTKTNAPAVELLARNTDAEGNDNAYWDFYAEPTDASFRIRERKFGGAGVDMMTISSATGNVGIGTSSPPTEKLSVNGNIRTKKLIVTQTGWADFVFRSSYKLRSLQSVKAFIAKNNHLPDVPSEGQVKRKGLDVAETQAILLRKIEELTLYVIEQDKKNQKLQQRIEQLENN